VRDSAKTPCYWLRLVIDSRESQIQLFYSNHKTIGQNYCSVDSSSKTSESLGNMIDSSENSMFFELSAPSRLRWCLCVRILSRWTIQLLGSNLLMIHNRLQARCQLHRMLQRLVLKLSIGHQHRQFHGLGMYSLIQSHTWSNCMFRERLLCGISNSVIAILAVFIFTCIAATIGIIVVCFTAPKPQGMFF
jgi:hypothetical protein